MERPGVKFPDGSHGDRQANVVIPPALYHYLKTHKGEPHDEGEFRRAI